MFVTVEEKFPAFYGTRWFITVFTRAHHWRPFQYFSGNKFLYLF